MIFFCRLLIAIALLLPALGYSDSLRIIGPANARALFADKGNYIQHPNPEYAVIQGFSVDILVSTSSEWMMKLEKSAFLDGETLWIIDRQPLIVVGRTIPPGPAMPGIRRWWQQAQGTLPIITPYDENALYAFFDKIYFDPVITTTKSADETWGMMRTNQTNLAILTTGDIPAKMPDGWQIITTLPADLVDPIPISAVRISKAQNPEMAGILLKSFAQK